MAIQYRRILELAQDHGECSIAANTGHSLRKGKGVIERHSKLNYLAN